MLLRLGQFVGDLGGSFSAIALPATIVLGMNATPMQIGALDAVSSGMIPLCAAAAGIVADRVRRRPLLIASNLVRLVALLLIPLGFALGHPPLWLFFAVAAVVAAASSVFDSAYAAFVPCVVGESNIAAATSKLAMGGSLAELAGTGLGGALVMIIGAPLVLFLNVVTFVCATATLAGMRVDEGSARMQSAGASLRSDIAAGIGVVLAHPVLRRVTLSNAVAHFGGGMAAAVATIYIYRDLHLSPMALGIVMGLANVGAAAAWYADAIAERFGMRSTLAGAHLVSAAGKAMLPLLAGMFPLVALLASRMLLTAAGPVFAVNDASLRLSIVPDGLRGRATATARTIVWAALPAGSLAGGFLGGHIGLAATMFAGAITTACAALLLQSPKIAAVTAAA
jgi:MFS family permease